MVSCSWWKKITAYNTMNFVNCVIFIISLIVAIFAIFTLRGYDDSSFFSTQLYTSILIFTLLSFGLVYLGCIGSKNPREKPNYIFCYWIILSILLVGNGILFGYFTVFIKGVSDSDYSSSPIMTIYRNRMAKRFNDAILSSYVACCTGCSDNFSGLTCNIIGSPPIEPYCKYSYTKEQSNNINELKEGDCILPYKCDRNSTIDNLFKYVGVGCFQSIDDVPGYNIGVDTCSLFEYFDLVGELPNSCGSGLPSKYVENVIKYFDSAYYKITFPWALLLIFLVLAWCSALYFILFKSAGRNLMAKELGV